LIGISNKIGAPDRHERQADAPGANIANVLGRKRRLPDNPDVARGRGDHSRHLALARQLLDGLILKGAFLARRQGASAKGHSNDARQMTDELREAQLRLTRAQTRWEPDKAVAAIIGASAIFAGAVLAVLAFTHHC
jgi:hypothetical protein